MATRVEAEIAKIYSPESIEPHWARIWVESKMYRPSDSESARPRFSLMLPPPNITGSLHIGHMLEHTEIDILMRWHRMRGEDVLWLPGTDHASIATQMIVEQELGREALPGLEGRPEAAATWRREGRRLRLEMGREKFLERCWKWKEESGGTIRKQMERLGASCDWTRERFTMDPAYSQAVVEVFVQLYEQGLIYRDKYIVNWCPRCGTAVSDLEVLHEEREGKLWHIRYPFEDHNGFITVATTRPETMLGDTAVAVNPQDERYQSAVGRRLELPLVKRLIPVVADDFVDPGFGTGAVKVTPAHDINDFGISVRHNLPRLKILDETGTLTAEAGPYQRLDRETARRRVLDDLRAEGLLIKTEDYPLSVGVCSRCKTVVEPLLSEQWFLKVQPLAGPAIQVVEENAIRIVPETYRKVYLDWMYNLHDWCISRQLWWGHRIPAWTCEACGELIVARETPIGCPKCEGELTPETDVLDTWFSSALWPFATLGWPEKTRDLERFYPTDLMIMGFDILFFWGARMIMMGLKFREDVPFRELYIHALVRDAERQKMSKTKGNVIDPIEVTEKYGTDAVRFAFAISAAPGTDIAFSLDKIESYRAFANKIWNAGRFILTNFSKLNEKTREQLTKSLQDIQSNSLLPERSAADLALADEWIFSRLESVTRDTGDALTEYRFHEAAFKIYHFFWHEFCDWYLEWVKPVITAPEADESYSAWENLLRLFESALHLLHPFMPFITEELWHRLADRSDRESISLASFALVSPKAKNTGAEQKFESIRSLIVAARNAKSEIGRHQEKPAVRIKAHTDSAGELIEAHRQTILRLAGLKSLERVQNLSAAIPVNAEIDIELEFEKGEDQGAERSRLTKEKEKLTQALVKIEAQLNNRAFLEKAPPDVVRGAENRRDELSAQLRRIVESLERLS